MATILAALPEDVEAMAHQGFRRAGGDGQRWKARDWHAMACALTLIEDWLEINRPRFDRQPVRSTRRMLEVTAP